MARKVLAPILVERIIERTKAETNKDPDYNDVYRADEERAINGRLRTHFDRKAARETEQ